MALLSPGAVIAVVVDESPRAPPSAAPVTAAALAAWAEEEEEEESIVPDWGGWVCRCVSCRPASATDGPKLCLASMRLSESEST